MLGTLTRPAVTDVDTQALDLWRKYAPFYLVDLLPLTESVFTVSDPLRLASKTVTTQALFYKPDQKRKMKGPGGGQFEETGAESKHKAEADAKKLAKQQAKAAKDAAKESKKIAATSKKAATKTKSAAKAAKAAGKKEGIASLAPGEHKILESTVDTILTVTGHGDEVAKPKPEWAKEFEGLNDWQLKLAGDSIAKALSKTNQIIAEKKNIFTPASLESYIKWRDELTAKMEYLQSKAWEKEAPATGGTDTKQVVGNPAGPGKALVYEGNKVTAYNNGKAQTTLELGDPKLTTMLPKAMETLKDDQAGEPFASYEYQTAQKLKELVYTIGKGHAFMLGGDEGKKFLQELAEVQAYGKALQHTPQAGTDTGSTEGMLPSEKALDDEAAANTGGSNEKIKLIKKIEYLQQMKAEEQAAINNGAGGSKSKLQTINKLIETNTYALQSKYGPKPPPTPPPAEDRMLGGRLAS